MLILVEKLFLTLLLKFLVLCLLLELGHGAAAEGLGILVRGSLDSSISCATSSQCDLHFSVVFSETWDKVPS